ncbi:hypothetical protein [Nostoc sp. DSM 114161]|uniref:hypothetical protein n=1 Tax=Nostoc sp. DSM 114161 TaxID=3440143 RepID=UPI0040463658
MAQCPLTEGDVRAFYGGSEHGSQTTIQPCRKSIERHNNTHTGCVAKTCEALFLDLAFYCSM